MQRFVCEVCGSDKYNKTVGVFYECAGCGCNYTIEQVRNIIFASAPTVTVKSSAAPKARVFGKNKADFKICKNRLEKYTGTDTAVAIPEGVSIIGQEAFTDCAGITMLKIPAGVKTIERNAFAGCTGLEAVCITDLAAWCGISFESAYSNPLTLAHVLYIKSEPFPAAADVAKGTKKKLGHTFCRRPEFAPAAVPGAAAETVRYAFCRFTKLTSAAIPGTVTRIGAYAFCRCTGLESVTIPGTAAEIGEYAFCGCTGLTSAKIENGAGFIGNGAFKGCTGLTAVTVPGSVTCIGKDYINTVPSNGGDSENRRGKIPPAGPDGKTDRKMTFVAIPSLKGGVFENCTGLTSVTLEEGVKFIGNGAFRGCTGLTDIKIPQSVTGIGEKYVYAGHFNGGVFEEYKKEKSDGEAERETDDKKITVGIDSFSGGAFENCTGLKSFTLPDGITEIYSSTFKGCTGLSAVAIHGKVTEIGSNAFNGCAGLKEIEIPGSATHIGIGAFTGCTGLTTVTVPENVTEIGEYAFSGCTGIIYFIIKEGIKSIGPGAFSGCTKLKFITLPNSITDLGDCAFADCTGLCSAVIPHSVTHIGSRAFAHCTGLTYINIPDSAELTGTAVFEGCNKIKEIIVSEKLIRRFYGELNAFALLREARRKDGKCQLCGGDFEEAFSGDKCKTCGRKKDY